MPSSPLPGVPRVGTELSWRWQGVAWLAGLGIALPGMLGMVGEWALELATLEFLVLLIAPVLAMWPGSRHPVTAGEGSPAPGPWTRAEIVAVGGLAVLSLTMSLMTAARIGDLPPAYHDEYSYRFQAESVLAGRWTWPSSPVRPELFDQMHVLNEGRMASRYYPGTGTWLAPWVAVGHPYWGQWFAGALATALVYAVGRELGSSQTAFVAGLTLALSPGLALFSNLLLAHHPTLLALSFLIWGMVRGLRTNAWADFGMAGCGLAAGMLCRPATAAGMGLPWGIACLVITARQLRRRNFAWLLPMWLGLGIPLLAGIGIAGAYNTAVTGNWATSPYQLYTDIYTPRHVYGLNNVVRGERHLGPKVLEDYDRWAENLTPELANRNVRDRLLITGLWTFGPVLLVMTAVLSLPLFRFRNSRWGLVAASIVSLHAIHWPYWYVGIMGWHYVFETAPLWCLLFGHATTELRRSWRMAGRRVLSWWWFSLLGLAWMGMYVTIPDVWEGRWQRGIGSIWYPRAEHGRFRDWIDQATGNRPALVLVAPEDANPHLDFVVNHAGLRDRVLVGRLRGDPREIAADFPDRDVYVCRPNRHQLERVPGPEK